MKKLQYFLTIQIVYTVIWCTQKVYTKKSSKQDDEDKEENLYRKVLPYIKEIALSAGLTQQEIKMPYKHKEKLSHLKNIQLLTELDKKVLPWLNEVTLKVNKIAESKADKIDKFRKKTKTHIRGPSALNSDQSYLVETPKHIKNKSTTENHLNNMENNMESFHQETHISESPQLQDFETPHLQDFDDTQLQDLDTTSKTDYHQDNLLVDEENKMSLDVASEVAKLTNQIAEFQQEIVTKKENRSFKTKEYAKQTPPKKSTSKVNHLFSKTIEELVTPLKKKYNSKKKVSSTEKNFINKKKEKKKPLKTVKLIFGGNLGLDGIIRYKVEEEICTFNESFDGVKSYFEAADHVIVNLESSIGPNENSLDINNISNIDLEAAQALIYAGIETVVLANEYIVENGPNAVSNTKEILTKKNILVSGITEDNRQQEPVTFANNGITIGILSYCGNSEGCLRNRNETRMGPAVYTEDLVKKEVTELRESGIDIVVVYLHWGNEDSLITTVEVKELVRNLSSIKIDALVGCHPLIQNHYFYKNMLVSFNIGNLLTPMHVHFSKVESHTGMPDKKVNKFFGKRNEHWETPIFSKLLQIEVNRDGIINNQSKYLPIRIGINQNHCLQTEKQPGSNWIILCSDEDKLCKR